MITEKTKRLQAIANKRWGWKSKKTKPSDHKTINTIVADLLINELPDRELTQSEVDVVVKAIKRAKFNY